LVLAAPLECPTTIVSILGDRDRIVDVAEMQESAQRMIRISGSDWTDCLWVKGYGDDSARGLDTDGLAAVWRHEQGNFVADGHVGGTFQRP
jgi:hypothetical protein